MKNTIFLSPPCVGAEERAAVMQAFDSKYVAPCGPMVDEFECRLAELSGRRCAVAVSSGTAAIDLAMAELGVDSTWTVIAPSLTFMATVGPAYHRGAKIVFVDSDETGNVDVHLLEEAFAEGEPDAKRLFIGVDLYGRCCDYDAIEALCARHGIVFVCDAAEAVGAKYKGQRPAGSAGIIGIFSFNGNKIITTSGGGALLADDEGIAARARKRSQQSREPVPWYEHREVGYNYRMSNILASIGLAQLRKLPDFIERRRKIKEAYGEMLSSSGGGFTLLKPVEGENNWLTVALAADEAGRDNALSMLAKEQIEARPVWKPLHLQPVFSGCRFFGTDVAEGLFRRGICLPSGPGMTSSDLERIAGALFQ